MCRCLCCLKWKLLRSLLLQIDIFVDKNLLRRLDKGLWQKVGWERGWLRRRVPWVAVVKRSGFLHESYRTKLRREGDWTRRDTFRLKFYATEEVLSGHTSSYYVFLRLFGLVNPRSTFVRSVIVNLTLTHAVARLALLVASGTLQRPKGLSGKSKQSLFCLFLHVLTWVQSSGKIKR